MQSVIEINDLVVRYHKIAALNGLSLKVERGEVFGFLGPNGAGKSTTIKTLLGLIRPSSGTVRLHGLDPSDVHSRVRVGYLPEETTFYRFLTPAEILQFYGEIFLISKALLRKRIQELLDKVGLSSVRDRQLRTFSKGMVQKVGLAQALINDPETLILDEPMSGLDPLARLELRDTLKKLKEEGKTLFISSHELSEVELLCDKIAIVNKGRIVKYGALAEILGGAKEKSLERFFLETIREN